MMESVRLLQSGDLSTRETGDRTLVRRLKEITIDYFPLAFISFGGPAAHVALLHARFVVEKQWLSDKMFAEIFAICAALPGPASTQLAYTVALIRDDIVPALYAFLLWSLPGAILMALLGSFVGGKSSSELPQWVFFLEDGLASAAVALVALAAYNLGRKLCKSRMQKFIGTSVFCATAIFEDIHWLSPVCMVFGGLVALAVHVKDTHLPSKNVAEPESEKKAADLEQANENIADPPIQFSYSWQTGVAVLAVWFLLFVASIFLRMYSNLLILQLFGTLFYVGSIIFGGGPVMIPLLYVYVVTSGWVESSAFLFGLAVINSMPGPNFNFAAFCGALAMRKYGFWAALGGAFISWLAIFAPGLLIKTGVLPLWRRYRGFPLMQIIFGGVNAAAVGLVFAAAYLLSQKTLSISTDGTTLGTFPLGDAPIFVTVSAVTFISVLFFQVPAPFMIIFGGLVGLALWYISIM